MAGGKVTAVVVWVVVVSVLQCILEFPKMDSMIAAAADEPPAIYPMFGDPRLGCSRSNIWWLGLHLVLSLVVSFGAGLDLICLAIKTSTPPGDLQKIGRFYQILIGDTETTNFDLLWAAVVAYNLNHFGSVAPNYAIAFQGTWLMILCVLRLERTHQVLFCIPPLLIGAVLVCFLCWIFSDSFPNAGVCRVVGRATPTETTSALRPVETRPRW